MKPLHSLHIATPQGKSGNLSMADEKFLFTYADVAANTGISLNMPVRRAQYAHPVLHPIFQMNLPEGFMLEELRNRLAKIVNLDPMLLLSLTGAQCPIGRVSVQSPSVQSFPSEPKLSKGERLSEILEWDGTENLFEELVNKYIFRAGISGVQPKVLVPQTPDMGVQDSKATVLTQDLIVKSGRSEYPGLAANEYLCMTIAKEAGIAVPEFFLSKNKELFIMRRFDRTAKGAALGFEDMAALAGLSSHDKYTTSYRHVARLVEVFASGDKVASSLLQLFDMVALSCIVGNGDAHLKNFGLLYTDPTSDDCALAPAYDIVNTTAYIPEDVLALDLCGQKSFFSSRQGLRDFGVVCGVNDPRDRIQRLLLTAEYVLRSEADIAESIPHVVCAIQAEIDMLSAVFF
jgi:serine/threonine-protein kinase HipA